MTVVLALCLLLQDEAPTFGKDQRLAAAVYASASDPRHAAEFLEMGKAGIEIALPDGVRVRVGRGVDGEALRRVLAALGR